ncbi:AbrB family transcriptional regulator [Sporolactobacillus pectinivorans]|uniref:AbrB family transcriptional regulator n=1 Tax=Sporolactobacillus pectinivorans TaxID=1591408 RepID=UPI001EFDA685|nr:AbrB family transcriptional regulator [Sporolactobacillus pectinivorans]
MKMSFRLGRSNLIFIIISGIGGLVLSLTGLSIGWMIGTLIVAGILSLLNPKLIRGLHREKGLEGYWLRTGQLLLGIEIGQQINLSVINVLTQGWLTITAMILISIILSLASGFVLFHFSKTDLITSLYGTTPGGLSSMLGIAADVGANVAIVSIIQTMRVILVEGTIPVTVSAWSGLGSGKAVVSGVAATLNPVTAAGLIFAVVIAASGALAGKKLRMPAPWLLGSMLGVGIAQALTGLIAGKNLPIWWPHDLIIVAQLMIGASVGARLNRKMFAGVARTVVMGLLGSLGLMAAMFLCALLVTDVTGIDPVTSILAFSPGGIDVMAVTSVVLHANSTFVVAVQVLRVLAICIILPPFFSLMARHQKHSEQQTKVSSG